MTPIITDTLSATEIRQLGEVQEAGARAHALIVSDIVLPPCLPPVHEPSTTEDQLRKVGL